VHFTILCAKLGKASRAKKKNMTMTPSETDKTYMARCLQLAEQAIGHTYPNPMVGSVIVHNGKIIGEGYHCKAGEPHAEVNAIASVKDESLLSESTLYVNLEPCAHFGRTPPCSLLIIEKKIPCVVIGCVDTFSKVAGKGIEMLRQAGVEVVTGVLEAESRWLNRRFFTFHEKQRPYIILKWAQTLDGFIDIDRNQAAHGQPTWITNSWARRAVHRLRSHEQAIMVGTHTAWKDNPALTVRDWVGANPLRLVIDREGKLPPSLKIFNHESATWVITEKRIASTEGIEYITLPFDENLLTEILNHLHKANIQSLIVEGGRQLLQSFIDAGLWDEAWLFTGEKFFHNGVKAPSIKGNLTKTEHLGDSSLFIYHNID
jgi:diaminohydroxyphosphoribosylaminopyrimidine deaminase/5-amino-6-(5-phosphoribosylamino)uracil reductase